MLIDLFRPGIVWNEGDPEGGDVTLDKEPDNDSAQDAPADTADPAAEADDPAAPADEGEDEPTGTGLTEEEILDLIASDPDKFASLIDPKKAVGRFAELTSKNKDLLTANQQYEQVLSVPAIRQAMEAHLTGKAEPQEQKETIPLVPEGEEPLPDLTDEQLELMEEWQILQYKESQNSQRFRARQQHEAKQNAANQEDAALRDAAAKYTAEQARLIAADKLTLTPDEATAMNNDAWAFYMGAQATGNPITAEAAAQKAYAIAKPNLIAKAEALRKKLENQRTAQGQEAKREAAGTKVETTGGPGGTFTDAEIKSMSPREITEAIVRRVMDS